MIFNAFIFSCPVPGGIFTPYLSLGAGFGVGYHIIIKKIFHLFGLRTDILLHESIYAVVGATAMCSSVTRTVSIAIVMFEITHDFCYVIHILVGVLASYLTSEYVLK